MKYTCKHCGNAIEIPQSEKAKTGLKLLKDHEMECFKKRNPNFGTIMREVFTESVNTEFYPKIPDRFNRREIIAYLDKGLKRIPTESEVLRFNMLLQTNPTKKDCWDFMKLLKVGFQ
jgi:hypothetical protein